MKKNLVLLLCGILIGSAVWSARIVIAEDITNTGMSQKALVAFLEQVVTFNSNARYTKELANDLKSKHNVLFNQYSALHYSLRGQAITTNTLSGYALSTLTFTNFRSATTNAAWSSISLKGL